MKQCEVIWYTKLCSIENSDLNVGYEITERIAIDDYNIKQGGFKNWPLSWPYINSGTMKVNILNTLHVLI